jgi:hypothetical protein
VTFHWLLTIAAGCTAIAAWIKARRLGRRLERLTESYWELRYEHGQLRSRMDRTTQGDAAIEPPRVSGTTAFVPLSSLKR